MSIAIEMAKQAWRYSGHNVLLLPLVALNGWACFTQPNIAQLMGAIGWLCAGLGVGAVICKEVIAGLTRDYEAGVDE